MLVLDYQVRKGKTHMPSKIPKDTKCIYVYLPKKEHKKLSKIAKNEGKSVSKMVGDSVIKIYGLDLPGKEGSK